MTQFTEWFDSIKDILDENIAAHLMETKQDKITAIGLLKGDGDGGISGAVPGVDYAVPGNEVVVLTNFLNLYVNPVTGNDNNDGLTANTAFLTINRALSEFRKYTVIRAVTRIYLAPGVYNQGVNMTYFSMGNFYLQGDTSNPASVVLDSVTISGSTGGYYISGVKTASISFDTVQYGAVSNCVLETITTTGRSVSVLRSVVNISNCSFTGVGNAIFASTLSTVYSSANTGSGNAIGLLASSSIIFKSGTQPTGMTAEQKQNGGQIFG